ncbi:MAG: rhomboid family intramembrane serine protease [Bacteroidales bacterium]|nr:rhomboid family intramembrane serine protease [Bacteroidales bacterium]
MNQYRPNRFAILPPVVKNLLIINILFFLATVALQKAYNYDLTDILGLHYFKSSKFMPFQYITYMFMHGSLGHIFFNMFALWMFGNVLENVWGGKRFLFYYIVTGIGAGLVQLVVSYIRIKSLEAHMSMEAIDMVYKEGLSVIEKGMNYADPFMGKLNAIMNSSTIGASGAVFGILLAFGMLFPNSLIYVYFAIPVKAKYFVIIYGIIELSMGFANRAGDNVAHFAHLGGMLFGLLLILAWKRDRTKFY